MSIPFTFPWFSKSRTLGWDRVLALCCLFFWGCRAAQAPATTPDNTLEVVVFLSAECPICQKQTLTLNQLVERYPEVQFKGVFTHWDPWRAIRFFEKKYKPAFPVFRDNRRRHWVEQLGAAVTPEVFLLQNGQVRYRGAIDNWFYAPGRHRPAPTVHYLSDAITAIRRGETVSPAQTEAIGCLIEQ